MKKGIKTGVVLLMLFGLPMACLKFQRAEFPEKRYFLLEVQRPEAAVLSRKPVNLRMQRLRVPTEFEGKNFVYRTGPMTYESDYYNQFFISPADMLTGNVREWLQSSGLFQYVSHSSGFIDTPYVLQGEVSSFYGDFREKTAPKAILEIEFFIFDAASPRSEIVFQKRYHEDILVNGKKPDDLISGWDQCLKRILTSFEGDLSKEGLPEK